MRKLIAVVGFVGVFSIVIASFSNEAQALTTKKRARLPLTSSALGDVCSNVVPIKLLIKTTAGGHIISGPRVTGYSVICSRKQCIQGRKASFYYSDGVLAGQVGYYGRWVGNGQARYYGGTGGAKQHFASRIAKIAKTKADKRLFLDLNNGQCVAFNATGRNGSPF